MAYHAIGRQRRWVWLDTWCPWLLVDPLNIEAELVAQIDEP
jgi:hypothetical protein